MRYLNFRHPSYLVGFLIISVLILCGLSIPYLFNTLYSARNASENFNQRLECASDVDCYGFSICDSTNTCKANYRIFSIPFYSEKFDTNLKRTPLPWILDSISPTDVSDTIFTNTGVTLYVVDKQHIFVSLAYHHAVADNLSETVEQKREYIQRLLGPYLDMETYIFADSDTSTANSKRFFKSYVLPASKLQNNIRNNESISRIHVISPHVYLIHYESQTMDLIFMDTAGLSSCKRLPYYKHDIQKDNLNSYVSTLFDNEPPGDWNLELVMPTGSHWILLMKRKNETSPKRKKLPIRMDLLGELIKPVKLQPIDESFESIEKSITTNKNHPLTVRTLSVKDRRVKYVWAYKPTSGNWTLHQEFKTSELFKTLENFPGKKVRFIDSAVSRNKITPSTNRPMSDLYPYIFNDDVVSSLNPKLVLVQPPNHILNPKEPFMNEHGISFIDILLFIYELIHVVNQEVGDKSYFDNSNLINFVYPFQRGNSQEYTISVLVEDTTNYEELILNQFHRLSPIESVNFTKDLTDGDFKNYFRVFEHFPNNFLNDTTNVTRMKQLVEKIFDMRLDYGLLDSINFTIPPDTYNTKRINHFKTMFGTFEKEFGSAMFFQENVYAHKGRTVLGNASDFVSKLDSLYSEGYVPTTSILKCNLKGNLTNYTNNLFGSHGSTTVIKHFMIKMKDLFLTNVNNFYCHTGTSCIKGQERYRFNLQSYWGGSWRERNLKRVVSDVYFVCFTAPAGESMDGFIIPPKTQWIPMYSILYYNIITGDTVNTMIENCLDDNFNGNVFSDVANNKNIQIKQYDIQSKTEQRPISMNDGYMLLYDKYTTQISTVKIYISTNIRVTPSIAVVRGNKSFENLQNELKELSDNHGTLFNSVSDIVMYSEPSRKSLETVNFDNRSFQIVSTLSTPGSALSTPSSALSTPSSALSTPSSKSLLERWGSKLLFMNPTYPELSISGRHTIDAGLVYLNAQPFPAKNFTIQFEYHTMDLADTDELNITINLFQHTTPNIISDPADHILLEFKKLITKKDNYYQDDSDEMSFKIEKKSGLGNVAFLTTASYANRMRLQQNPVNVRGHHLLTATANMDDTSDGLITRSKKFSVHIDDKPFAELDRGIYGNVNDPIIKGMSWTYGGRQIEINGHDKVCVSYVRVFDRVLDQESFFASQIDRSTVD